MTKENKFDGPLKKDIYEDAKATNVAAMAAYEDAMAAYEDAKATYKDVIAAYKDSKAAYEAEAAYDKTKQTIITGGK